MAPPETVTARIRSDARWPDTVREIGRLALLGVPDMAFLDDRSLRGMFDYIHALPYVADPEGVETVSRPGLILDPSWKGPRDCDDKACAVLAGLWRRGIDGRLAVVGTKPDRPHHVYTEALLVGLRGGGAQWVPLDPTYPDRGEFGKRLYEPEAFRRVLNPRFFPVL